MDAYVFLMYRVKVEQIILFVKAVNRYFERKEINVFWWRHFQGFDNGSVRIKGSKTWYLFTLQ